MIKPVKQLAVAVFTVALAAAPVISCCLGFAGHAHAAPMQTAVPADQAAGHDHCADGEAEAAVVPAENHGADGGGCTTCDGVHLKTQAVSAVYTDVPAGTDMVSLAATAYEQPDFMPSLLRRSAPPQGPPLIHRTPVYLNTTLRL